MNDEDKTAEAEVEAKEQTPKRRGRPAKKTAEAEPKEETATPEATEEEASVEAQEEEVSSEAAPEDSGSEESVDNSDDVIVVKAGDGIDVPVDENGIAQRTVVREEAMRGSDRVTRYVVAVKGSYYKK